MLCLCVAVASAQVVNFTDANLEAAIREAIAKPSDDIYEADLAGLTELRALGSDIFDLSGLEHCSDLVRLWLGDNQISNLQPVAGLADLQQLYFWDNQISDLQPLAGLSELSVLDLSGNEITDLQPLAALTGLNELALDDNGISNLQPLVGLSNLRLLGLSSNEISDLSHLAGLSGLQYLDLGGNQIADLASLAGRLGLQLLDLSDNSVTDLQPLSGLTNLEYLYLSGNALSDLAALAGLTNLTDLDLSGTLVSDIGPLVANPGLGQGDFVGINRAWLDLSAGSQASSDVQSLRDRGVTVWCENQAAPQSPAMPTNLTASVTPDDYVELNWTDNSDNEQGFTIKRCRRNDDGSWPTTWTALGSVGPDICTYTDTSVSQAGRYRYRVRAYNSVGTSSWTPAAEIWATPGVPTAPSNFTLQLVNGGNKLSLAWQDNSGNETAFNLERRYWAPAGTWSAWIELLSTAPNLTGLVDDQLPFGSSYQYRIRAVNAAGGSAWAESPAARCEPTPLFPDNLAVELVNDGQASKLTWNDKSQKEENYQVQRRRWLVEGKWSQWSTVLWAGPNVTEFLDDAIPVGSSYQYRVQALNSAGASAWAESWGLRCEATPLWPVGLTAQQAPAGDHVELSWRDKSAVEEGFDLERRQQNPDRTWPESWTALASLPADTQAYSDDSIAEEGMYEYRIRAYNALGSSEWSLTAEMPWSGSGLPAGPSGVNGHAVNDGTAILVSWLDHSSTETGFKVQRRHWLMAGGWSEWTTVLWTAPNFIRFVDDSVPVGSSYQYRVRAVNASGFSAWAVSTGIRCEPTPLWPDNLQARLVNSGQDVELTWTDKSSKEDHYEVQRRQQLLDGSYSAWSMVASLTANSTAFVDDQIPGDGWYEYQVGAVAGTAASYGGPVGIARESTGPLPPLGFSGQVVHSGCDVALSWVDRSASELYLKVQRRAEVSEGVWAEWTTVVWLGSNRTNWLDDGLPGDGNYEYRAQTFNAQGTSEWSQVAGITRAAGAGGAAALSVASLNVTQVNGQCASIVYNLSAAADVSIEVRNIAGRLVRAVPCGEVAAGINTATWNLRNSSGALVPAGRYLCTLRARCTDGTQTSTIRTVTVQR